MEHENVVVISEKSKRATDLNQHIQLHAELVQKNLYEVCKGLKEMRDDKLYKEIGYQNFEDYCENEVGIKRRQAYNYISVAESLSENFVQSTAQIGTEKLILLAKLDEPQREEIIQTVDLNSVTVKELTATVREQKEKIKALEESAEKQKAESESELRKTQEEFEDFKVGAKRRQDTLMEKAKNLIEHVKELENRPIEVAVQEPDTAEIDRLNTENEMLRKQLAEKPMIQEMFPSDSNMHAEFDAYLKILNDAMKHLCAFVVCHEKKYDMSSYISEITEKIESYTSVMRKEEETCQ